jgi:hypothetical protein
LRANCIQKLEAKRKQATLTPIVSSAILEHVQIHLVDYSRHQDLGYGYVLHIKDHFSKFTLLHPCLDKTAEAVQQQFEHWIGHFGVPKLVQSDNGGEFCGVLEKLFEREGIEVAHGRPKHPQSRGCVEHGNGVFKKKLATLRERNNTSEFVRALPHIALAINKQQHGLLPNRMLPYEVMFGRKPHWEHRVPPHIRQFSRVADSRCCQPHQQVHRTLMKTMLGQHAAP